MNTRIAVFGNTTIKAVEQKGLRVDIAAPTPETPSMTMALEKYIEKMNKKIIFNLYTNKKATQFLRIALFYFIVFILI